MALSTRILQSVQKSITLIKNKLFETKPYPDYIKTLKDWEPEDNKQNEPTMLVNKENQDVFLVVPNVVVGERYFIIRECDFPTEYHIGDVYLSKEKWLKDTFPTFERYNMNINHNVFATEKQAKSAFAMAQISQIMANDERFGGVVTDKEWHSRSLKYIIERQDTNIKKIIAISCYSFLAFHTSEQRDLFLKEYKDLIKDYLMLD